MSRSHLSGESGGPVRGSRRGGPGADSHRGGLEPSSGPSCGAGRIPLARKSEELSDWDFAVTTSDFAAVGRDLPALIAPLCPLGQQWEPLGHFPVYQVLLAGPTKVEYLFLDRSQHAMPALEPAPATLDAINTHFWDWIWWIATKASIGRHELVAEHLAQLFDRLLAPIGVTDRPADIAAAIDAFVSRRDELERDYGVTVSRALEEEVRAGIRRLGLAS